MRARPVLASARQHDAAWRRAYPGRGDRPPGAARPPRFGASAAAERAARLLAATTHGSRAHRATGPQPGWRQGYRRRSSTGAPAGGATARGGRRSRGSARPTPPRARRSRAPLGRHVTRLSPGAAKIRLPAASSATTPAPASTTMIADRTMGAQDWTSVPRLQPHRPRPQVPGLDWALRPRRHAAAARHETVSPRQAVLRRRRVRVRSANRAGSGGIPARSRTPAGGPAGEGGVSPCSAAKVSRSNDESRSRTSAVWSAHDVLTTGRGRAVPRSGGSGMCVLP